MTLLLAVLLCLPLWAGEWTLLGPNGGDARTLAYDPQNPDHIFVGTSTGSIFVSVNGGRSWSGLSHLGSGDFVVGHIVVDPRNAAVVFASGWRVEDQKSGDVFRSRDGGKTWVALADMRGKSVRALAMAPFDSNLLASGTLDGVYSSKDGGDSWQRISPANHGEIKNVESIAIDPNDRDVIYAGTWHLAWKTKDGGVIWHRINQGMIDDSDVFSIIVDPANPSLVYASACSGIYKSESAGELFRKVSGIPFAARRTRVLKQDPTNPDRVYAGTTQGLWKTTDSGKTWKQMTDSSLVVNDILVDPRSSSRLLLATDRNGVMVSENGGATFSSSNSGFTHHYVTTVLPDANDPDLIFVGIINERDLGGVFSSRDGGNWQQRSTGLGGRDVFALAQTTDGTLIAGTSRGLFRLDRNAGVWRPIALNVMKSDPLVRTALRKPALDPPSATQLLMSARVNDVAVGPNRWLAATSAGLFASADNGRSWKSVPELEKKDFVAVRSTGDLVVAATHREIFVSADEGMNWQLANLPSQVTTVRSVAVAPDSRVLVASLEGAFRSSDFGKNWEHMINGLPERDLSFISYDGSTRSLLATSLSASAIFQSQDGGESWSRVPDVGYPLRRVTTVHGRLVAVTPFDGIIAQK